MSEPFTDRFRCEAPAHSSGEPELQLWAAVLAAQIADAVRGAVSIHGDAAKRARITADARRYFRKPDPSLAVICELLGLDPVAVRDRVMRQIEDAEREVASSSHGMPMTADTKCEADGAPGGGSRLPNQEGDRRGDHRTRHSENKFSRSRHALH